MYDCFSRGTRGCSCITGVAPTQILRDFRLTKKSCATPLLDLRTYLTNMKRNDRHFGRNEIDYLTDVFRCS